MRIKRRIFSGAVCEQEVFSVSDRVKNLHSAEPLPRFKNEEERDRHKLGISRRHHARLVNANFSPQSLYSTLTLDNENEVHTFDEAWKLGTLLMRRLKYANPEAKLILYMGRGKSTQRIHFHMLSDGLTEAQIRSKWKYGQVIRIEHLRPQNRYGGVDHGQDYTGLANYLFDHWTPEQRYRKRYRSTTNLTQPEREPPQVIKRNYTAKTPPKAPKGYKLVGCIDNGAGYLCFKYVLKVPISKTPLKSGVKIQC